MSTVPIPEDLGRLGVAAEGSFKASPGTVKDVDGLMSLTVDAGRALLERGIMRNSQKDQYAPRVGNQTYKMSCEVLLSSETAPDCGDWIKTSMGEEVAVDALTFSSANSTTVTKSAGTFDDILRLTVGGSAVHRPVKSLSGSVATYAILPGGSATAVKNAASTSTPVGRAFRDDPDGAVTTYEVQNDQGGSGYAGEIPVKAQGCVPMPFKLMWTLDGLLKLAFSWDGAIWTPLAAGGSGLANGTDQTAYYLSDACSFGLQDLATPAALTEIGLKSLEITYGYEFMANRASQAISGGAIPGSNITGWVRHNSHAERVKCVINDADWETWDDAVEAGTKYQLWAEFYPGTPGATADGGRVCTWLPQVKVVSAKPVKQNGLVCTALEIAIERDNTIPETTKPGRRSYLSFFGST